MPLLPPIPVVFLFLLFAGLQLLAFASRRYSLAIVLSGVLIVPSVISSLTFLTAIALLMLAIAASASQLRAIPYAIGQAVILGIAVTSFSQGGQAAVEEVRQLRAEFPVVSLASRMAAERLRTEGSEGAEAAAAFRKEHTGPVVWGSRQSQLERLHDESYEQFVTAAGFGAVRMVRVHPSHIRLPKVEATPVVPEGTEFDDSPDSYPEAPASEALNSLFTTSTEEFVDPERFGWVKDAEHVAGFEPHAVKTRPVSVSSADEEWRVDRLQLVGLLRHDEPVAYESDHLPKLDELESVPTRALDEFEVGALAKLNESERLVIETQPGHIRMLGSLRAQTQCLACHDVKENTMLGAFSYSLRPVVGERTSGVDVTAR
jgi:hypothetical protein